jgi:3-hydroxybutyryl-CoA dehydrogenase
VATNPPATVYLIGDERLVNEFGRACHDSGIAVVCRINESSKAGSLPKFFRVSSKIPRSAGFCFELTNSNREWKKKNLLFLETAAPQRSVILTSSVVVTASEQATWLQHPRRLIGMSALPTLLSQKLIEMALTIHTPPEAAARASEFFSRMGKSTVVVQDRIGMVMPRILCALVNEASFALTDEIATPDDIDRAMKLGTNYPFGPIEWGDKIGFDAVFDVINAVYDDLHEERYRAAPLLRQLATGVRWWRT